MNKRTTFCCSNFCKYKIGKAMEQKLEHMNQNKTWRERSWRSTATNNWLPEGQTRLRSLSTSPLRSGRLQKSFHPTITSLKNLRNQEILGLLEEIGGYGHGDFMLLLIPCRCPPFQFDPRFTELMLPHLAICGEVSGIYPNTSQYINSLNPSGLRGYDPRIHDHHFATLCI